MTGKRNVDQQIHDAAGNKCQCESAIYFQLLRTPCMFNLNQVSSKPPSVIKQKTGVLNARVHTRIYIVLHKIHAITNVICFQININNGDDEHHHQIQNETIVILVTICHQLIMAKQTKITGSPPLMILQKQSLWKFEQFQEQSTNS